MTLASPPAPTFPATALGERLQAVQADGAGANREIAAYVLRNPVRLAAASIEEAAELIGVSPATLSRFARTAGFQRYAELRGALAETMQAILAPVEKLRVSIAEPSGQAARLRDGLEAILTNVRAAATGIAPQEIDAIVGAITAARTVYVMGFGLSAHLAGLLSLGLQPFCRELVNVVEFGGTEVAAGRLMNIADADALIVLSFPRYARDAIRLAEFARDRRASVIAITDAMASPLVPLARHALLADNAHPVLPTSLVAAVVIIETLVAALMVSNRQNVTQAQRLTDAISGYLADPQAPRAGRGSRSRRR